MKRDPFFEFIEVNERSVTPKYIQLTKSILNALDAGKIKKDDVLPSITEMSLEMEISRRTAEKGYTYLKKIGILGSVPGKGFFIKGINSMRPLKIFLLFNKLSAHKKIIYDSFVRALGENVSIDLYIYDNDCNSFKKLLEEKREDYAYYVIIPHFVERNENIADLINAIPREKLLLLDKRIPGISGCYAAAYENFEMDIYQAMVKALERLRKYDTIKIIFPTNSYYPKEILTGLAHFCTDYVFKYEVVEDIREEPIAKGQVFISVMEDDLVTLIERVKILKFKIGKEVGIISYNETPLKKIILNGITTISTDFCQMGKIAAELILNRSREHIEIPFHLMLRDSL
jgi:DNA-binding transcriptional regulator YhcF (GntR family)